MSIIGWGVFPFGWQQRRQLMVKEIRCVLQPHCGRKTQPLLLNWKLLSSKLERTRWVESVRI
jgi:hypothetical protein